MALVSKRGISSRSGASRRPRGLAIVTIGAACGMAYYYMSRDEWSKYGDVERAAALADQVPKKRVVVLGSGWAAAPFIKHLDKDKFDVTCLSPRNHFLFTPLLPSVGVGTVEARTVVEPMRKLVGPRVHFVEAECVDIDPINKVLTCQLPYVAREVKEADTPAVVTYPSSPSAGATATTPSSRSMLRVFSTRLLKSRLPEVSSLPSPSPSSPIIPDPGPQPSFQLPYDVLVVAIGSDTNTFNTPGVDKHAHFLKEVTDARRIRAAISDCFEAAALPGQTSEERQRLLHFVIVGGGPTGVEYAAELGDLLEEDMKKYFGKLATIDAKITVIEALDHVLSMMDKKISAMTEKHFASHRVNIMPNTFVKGVGPREVLVQRKGKSELEFLPCALVVWATGIKPRPLAQKIREVVGVDVQHNRRGILTDQHLAVKGIEDVYAIGDCGTIDQPQLMDNLAKLFEEARRLAPTGGAGLTPEALKTLVHIRAKDYPQLAFLFDTIEHDFREADADKNGTLDMEEFKMILTKADNRIRALPATAQVANQQGLYLSRYLNNTEPPLGVPVDEGRKKSYPPFNYKHMGALAYIGGDSAVADFTGAKFLDFLELGPIGGFGTFLFWRSFYLSEMFTTRTKLLLASDWLRAGLFGRDISRY